MEYVTGDPARITTEESDLKQQTAPHNIGTGTGPAGLAGPAMAGPFSAEVET